MTNVKRQPYCSELVTIKGIKIVLDSHLREDIESDKEKGEGKRFQVNYKTKLRWNAFYTRYLYDEPNETSLGPGVVLHFKQHLEDAVLGVKSYEDFLKLDPEGTQKKYNYCCKAKQALHDAGIDNLEEFSNEIYEAVQGYENIEHERILEITDFSKFDVSNCEFGDLLESEWGTDKIYFTKSKIDPNNSPEEYDNVSGEDLRNVNLVG